MYIRMENLTVIATVDGTLGIRRTSLDAVLRGSR